MNMLHGFVPPHLLRKLAEHPVASVRQAAIASIGPSAVMRTERRFAGPVSGGNKLLLQGSTLARHIYNCRHTQRLPGTPERGEGQGPTGDANCDNAYDGCGVIWKFWKFLGRNGFDDNGSTLICSVAYGSQYDNAMWQGQEIVGGDGDGIVFQPFFSVPDVIWHEWGHAVTQYTSNLDYQDESGGLNESFSDCHGITCKQWSLNQTAAQADWIIGKGLFMPSINGIGLRSMKAPGTAYDDPQLGSDPQIANYRDYTPGMEVHLSSGIPNKAFCDACILDGGGSWERVFPVWLEVNKQAGSGCTFAQWASLAVNIAGQKYGYATAKAISDAWIGVGVKAPVPVPSPSTPSPPVPPVPIPLPIPPTVPTVPPTTPGGPPVDAATLKAIIQKYLGIAAAIARWTPTPLDDVVIAFLQQDAVLDMLVQVILTLWPHANNQLALAAKIAELKAKLP